jgi:hypothetical protein
VKEI